MFFRRLEDFQSGDLCVVIQRHKNRLVPPCSGRHASRKGTNGSSVLQARHGELSSEELKGLGEGWLC